MDREEGQASIELVAALPALMLAGLIAMQLLVTGYALTLADGAAEAGALALAAGRPPADAARAALPGWAQDGVGVEVSGDEVTVLVKPPTPFGALANELAISSSATARRKR